MLQNHKKWRHILSAKLYLTDRTDELRKEIEANSVTLCISKKEIHHIDVNDILAFLNSMKQERKKQLDLSGINIDLIYYLWFDQQSNVLRFSFINSNHTQLPFSCSLEFKKNEAEIINLFFNDCEKDLLHLSNFESIPIPNTSDLSEDDLFDDNEHSLEIYSEVIKKTQRHPIQNH